MAAAGRASLILAVSGILSLLPAARSDAIVTAYATGAAADTASLLQRPEIPKNQAPPDEPEDETAASEPPQPVLIGLRRESVPIYRRGKIASFKTSYSGVVSVGSPAQHFRVVFDTGSGNLVLPAVECRSEACKVEGRRTFNMSASSSAVAVNTDGSPVPEGEPSDQVTIGFGTGEITGEFTRDVVCFGTAAAHEALSGVEAPNASDNSSDAALGGELVVAGAEPEKKELCAEMNVVLAVEMSTQPFKTFRFDGILGLGLDGLAMSERFSAFKVLFGAANLPAAHFGVFLTEGEDGEESEIAMGGHDPRRILDPLQFSPVVMPEFGYWQVEIVAVRINGVELDVCKDGTCRGVVDTGTSHLGIPAPADQEVAELLATEAGDTLDCRLSDAPELEIELKGINLTLHPFNYMRRLPLREGVSVSSTQGVHVPNETAPASGTTSAPATTGMPAFEKSALGQYCADGLDIRSEMGCRAAAGSLGLEFEHSWPGPGDHRYCLFAEDGRNRVFYNSAGEEAATTPPNQLYSSLCIQAADSPTAAPAPQPEAQPTALVATGSAAAEDDASATRFCRPRLMPVRLPAPLGPKLFILGEPVLHRYYTVYDWENYRVGFSLANNKWNTMDPKQITDRRGTLPKEVDALLMQKSVSVSRAQDTNRITGGSEPAIEDHIVLLQVEVKVAIRVRRRVA